MATAPAPVPKWLTDMGDPSAIKAIADALPFGVVAAAQPPGNATVPGGNDTSSGNATTTGASSTAGASSVAASAAPPTDGGPPGDDALSTGA
jgi:hypothetical protein